MTTLTASIEAERKPASISAARVVLAALAFVVLMQLHLAFTKAINWDEYWHYSLITASLRGEEVPFLQTPYIPLFSWVTQLPMAPIEQITLIRAFILAFEVVAAIAVYFAARRFTDHLTALLCALAYVTAGYAFLHGFALRADVIAAAFLTSALAVGLRAKVNLVNAALIGLLLILAVLSTIKSVLWAPAFIAVLVLRADELPASRSIVITALCGVLALVAGFFLFGGEAAENAMGTISRSSERMFSAGLFPLGGYFLKQLIFAPFFTALMGVLVYWLVRGQAERKVKIALALLAAPLLTVVFYRNSFPYYFAFIMPPVAIAIAPAIEIAVRRYGAAMMTAVLVLGAITLNVVEKRDRLDTQRQLQTQLRTVFPKPVIYIDESGMLGDYPRAALRFTSGWSLQRYWDDGEPLYSQRMMQDTVPLLIANSSALQNVFIDEPVGNRLLPEDMKNLRGNFISHGGIIYVAGKTIAPGQSKLQEQVMIPGEYRVEGNGLTLDGEALQDGDVIALERGRYDFGNTGETAASIRWAAAGEKSESRIGLQDLFTDY